VILSACCNWERDSHIVDLQAAYFRFTQGLINHLRRSPAPVAARSIHPAIARMLLTIIQITNIGVATELRRIIATATRRRRSRARLGNHYEELQFGQSLAQMHHIKGPRSCPLVVTMRDMLAWFQTLPAERRSKLHAGLDPHKEADILRVWHQDRKG
jgi:hypothetical protein